MHMADAMLSPAVGATMYVASGLVAAYSIKKIRQEDDFKKKIPTMGIMGAFVFATQMVNFTIPGTGSSGHLCGGLLFSSIPAWAFRFLQSIPGVTMVLSGMSNMDQLKANIETFSEEKPLNDVEMKTLLEIADGMLNGNIVPCTACRYCTSHCPMGLDIPKLLSLYNEHKFTGGGFIAPMAISALPDDKKPSACIGCGSCAAVCPQQINIPEILADFTKMLGE